MPLTPQHARCGGSREGAKGAVNLYQQVNIRRREALRPSVRGGHVALCECFTCEHARHQPGDLRAGVAAGAFQVTQNQRAVFAPQPGIAQSIKGARNVGVARLGVLQRYQFQCLGALQELAHLVECCELQEVHVNHHSLMINPLPFAPPYISLLKLGSASNLVGIRYHFRHHTSLDKTHSL